MQLPHSVTTGWLDRFQGQSVRKVSGGLSSSYVWQVGTGDNSICVKAWPTTIISSERLEAIHRWQRFVSDQLSFIPKLVPNNAGSTWICCREHFWECSTWLPGEPQTENTLNFELVHRAVEAIAQLHSVSRNYHHRTDVSPSVLNRLELLTSYLNHLPEFEKQVNSSVGVNCSPPHEQDLLIDLQLAPESSVQQVLAPSTIASAAKETLQFFSIAVHDLRRQLAKLTEPVELIWCMRDVHREHVLFFQDRVSGIIDFGAARADEPIIDLVRFLGSFGSLNSSTRRELVGRYEQLTGNDNLFGRFRVLDRASTLLSAMQWLVWMAVENRQFAIQPHLLLQRWQRLNQRLKQADW